MSGITCKECGASFQFTQAERDRYAKSGFAPPKRCRACRVARRARHAGGMVAGAGSGLVAGAGAGGGANPSVGRGGASTSPAGTPSGKDAVDARAARSSDRLEPVFDDPGDVDAPILDESGALDLPDVPRSPRVPELPPQDDDEPDVPGAREAEAPATPGRSGSASGRRPKVEHDVLCAACGALTKVPFKPTAKRPVYCDTCFEYR